MKIKFPDQYLTQAVTLGAGVGQVEVDLPELSAGDAVRLNRVFVSPDAASAAPTITAAGLALFNAAIAGKEQASPADLYSLERLLWVRALSWGATSAGPIGLSNEWTYGRDQGVPRFPPIPARELFVFYHLVNITNAATTILRFRMEYDIVTLTGAEQLAYLL